MPNSLLSRARLGMLPDTDQTLKTTDRSCWGEGAYVLRAPTEDRGRRGEGERHRIRVADN